MQKGYHKKPGRKTVPRSCAMNITSAFVSTAFNIRIIAEVTTGVITGVSTRVNTRMWLAKGCLHLSTETVNDLMLSQTIESLDRLQASFQVQFNQPLYDVFLYTLISRINFLIRKTRKMFFWNCCVSLVRYHVEFVHSSLSNYFNTNISQE